jgi:hypothetical protein
MDSEKKTTTHKRQLHEVVDDWKPPLCAGCREPINDVYKLQCEVCGIACHNYWSCGIAAFTLSDQVDEGEMTQLASTCSKCADQIIINFKKTCRALDALPLTSAIIDNQREQNEKRHKSHHDHDKS